MRNPVLLLIAFGNFAVGMGAFGVIGLLTPVAGAFAIPPSEAAWMMSLYALVYALTSPVLVALTGRFDRAFILTGGLVVFAFGAVLAAVAPDFTTVLVARALMALGGGFITPVGASIGVALVPAEQRGRALAIVFGGLTLAQALGVPACAWIGYALGWRFAFGLVAVMTFLCAGLLWRSLPRAIAVPPTTLASLGAVLASPVLVLAVAYTALFLGGAYVVFTFLGPFAEQRFGLGRDGVTALLLVFGVGAVVGNALGGFLSDRIGPLRTLVLLGCAQIATLLPMTLLPLPMTGLFVLVLLWSVACWAFMVPQQARLAALAPPLTPVLFALNAAAIYLGGSVGSVTGGQVLRGFGFEALGPAAAGLVLVGLGSLALVASMQRRPVAGA
ncbi:MFS transporter [Plastoroseomonas arctica]|uniref:MFS transporter n=1 Tax=Plastoroseomonas arctica TaxID=1509237 RepID=A0AAF1K674_9PROT|nr:MFS transporter [Plastoroseomonas arctica]MBR0656616.1 MFS transporter [Plastoroseomonas arctica]